MSTLGSSHSKHELSAWIQYSWPYKNTSSEMDVQTGSEIFELQQGQRIANGGTWELVVNFSRLMWETEEGKPKSRYQVISGRE